MALQLALILPSFLSSNESPVAPIDFDAVIAKVRPLASANRIARLATYNASDIHRNSTNLHGDVMCNATCPCCYNTCGAGLSIPCIGNDLSVDIAVLFRNENAADVAKADESVRIIITAFAASLAVDLGQHPPGCCGPLENSIVSRAIGLFNQNSFWVKQEHKWPGFTPSTQHIALEYALQYVEGALAVYGREWEWPHLSQSNSENVDTSRRTTCYFLAQTLALDANYSRRVLSDGLTVNEHYAGWEAFFYVWLGVRATHGQFVELSSTSYWHRTWPCIMNLADLPISSRVRKRAKMFVDIAMITAEQGSIGGVKAGQKSRCKKTYGVASIGKSMYSSMTPQLYGDAMHDSMWGNDRIIGVEAGFYEIANVSILIHRLGFSPDTRGVATIADRMIGQLNDSEIVSCSASRCAETLRVCV